MYYGPTAAGSGVKAGSDVTVAFPGAGVIRIESAHLFGAPDEGPCRRFLQAALRLPAIEGAWLAPNQRPYVDLQYDVSRHSRKTLLDQLASVLSGDAEVGKPMPVAPAAAARDHDGVVRYRRYAGRITGWFAERERVGSMRLRNPVLYRKRALCDAIERELMSVLGVSRYDTDAVKCRVDIEYDPRQISAGQLVEILGEALGNLLLSVLL